MGAYVIIVAGGKGTRMGSQLPKQFLLLDRKPILLHSIHRFMAAIEGIHCIVALPKEHIGYVSEMLQPADKQHIQLVEGGETRFQSVRNALALVPEGALVGIHDAVRPLIATETIRLAYKTAEEKTSAVVVVRSKDSLRKLQFDGHSQSVDRNMYYIVQTPQVFQSTPLKKAFLAPESTLFTDDASVFENNGGHIHLVEGSYANLKITTPEDLILAEALLKML